MRMRFSIIVSGFNQNSLQKLWLESNLKAQLLVQACSRHTGAHTGTLRPLKVTPLARRSRPDESSSPTMTRENQRRVLREDEPDPLEIMANTVSKYSSKYAAREAQAAHTRELIRNMRTIRFKTIESNYFKQPPSLSLLTWSAKEQIQYLHQTDPQTWTVQALSDLFPVSEKEIKEIIKSKVRIHREKDILQHDLTVQKNWADLKAALESEDDGTKDVYQAFRNSDNEIIITNAAGVEGLPFPVKKIERFNRKGLFSAIVTDCYEAKDEARKRAVEELKNKSDQLCAMLSEVSKIFDMKSQRKTSRLNFVESADVKNEFSPSEASYCDDLSARKDIHKLDNVNKQRNVHGNINISNKYKLSSFASHSEGTGFKRSDIPLKMKVPQNKTSSETFVAGDCVYDKNGEFLYRIV